MARMKHVGLSVPLSKSNSRWFALTLVTEMNHEDATSSGTKWADNRGRPLTFLPPERFPPSRRKTPNLRDDSPRKLRKLNGVFSLQDTARSRGMSGTLGMLRSDSRFFPETDGFHTARLLPHTHTHCTSKALDVFSLHTTSFTLRDV